MLLVYAKSLHAFTKPLASPVEHVDSQKRCCAFLFLRGWKPALKQAATSGGVLDSVAREK
jgi:hypothetical protein